MVNMFVFVEGQDDERFLETILNERYYKVIKYAREKKDHINKYIQSIKKMPMYDYIVLCDIDNITIDEKKKYIMSKFPECENEKIIVSIAEIESWYLAGLDVEKTKKMKIKYIENTEEVTKEKFNSLIPENANRTNFMIDILKNYDIDEAINRNSSFNYFISCYDNIVNMAV